MYYQLIAPVMAMVAGFVLILNATDMHVGAPYYSRRTIVISGGIGLAMLAVGGIWLALIK